MLLKMLQHDASDQFPENAHLSVAAFPPEVHAISTKLLLQNSEGYLRIGAVVTPVSKMRNSQALLVKSAN
ncbi:hypothetical protein BRAS3843_520255 [Bradyrhizobium sp. STM 3843]|nr:hypothetical protein BRAS3843_520255 [Bradyrhizobium sp. STM 3843]